MTFSEDLQSMGLTWKGVITNSGGVSLPDVLIRTGETKPKSK